MLSVRKIAKKSMFNKSQICYLALKYIVYKK